VKFANAYQMDSMIQMDPEFPRVRLSEEQNYKLPPPAADETFVVVRVMFDRGAADEGDSQGLVRFSPANIRLVVPSGSADDRTYQNYFPVGTMEKAILYINRIDDPLFVKGGNGVDLVFVVPRDLLKQADEGNATFAAGTYLVVKRMGMIDLSNKKVEPRGNYKPTEGIEVLRKPMALEQRNQQPAPPAR
jgi:hypothetical protein